MAESLNDQQTADLEDDFPEEVALLPVRDTVLFPRAVMPLNIGRESSISLVSSLGENKILAVVAQRDPRVESPDPDELFEVATLAVVHKSVRMPNNSLLIFCEGAGAHPCHGVYLAEALLQGSLRATGRGVGGTDTRGRGATAELAQYVP